MRVLARLTAVLILAVAVLGPAACAGTPTPDPTANQVAADQAQPARLRPQVLATLPHDRTAFTQGLELVGGVLYEGTGLEGRSELRKEDPETGAVSARVALPGEFFGEGITVVGPTVWQLTWQNGVAFRRDADTLAETGRVNYSGEGWGLCHTANGQRLVMSDGSDRLTFRDPRTFQPTGEVRVTSAGQPVTRLNELECVGDDTVYANVWQTDTIVRIDAGTGRVTGTVDLSGLLAPADRIGTDVLNGVAAVAGTDEFLVTGKLWPKMFRVKFVPAG